MKIFKKNERHGRWASFILFEKITFTIDLRFWGLGFSYQFIKPVKDHPELTLYKGFIVINILCIGINIPINNLKYNKELANEYYREQVKKHSEYRTPNAKRDTTKLEVIDNINSLGAVYRYINTESNIEVSYRDSNETLKVFINSKRKEE